MKNITLKGQRVQAINFISKLENGTKIELETRYSYNVNYSSSNNMCRGIVGIQLFDKANPDLFKIEVELIGIFDYNPDAAKETVHKESYKELFPYARALITTVTANAGIPPIIVPGMDIDSQDIYRFEKPNE